MVQEQDSEQGRRLTGLSQERRSEGKAFWGGGLNRERDGRRRSFWLRGKERWAAGRHCPGRVVSGNPTG